MAATIKTIDLIEKNRLSSLELLIYNHLGNDEKSIPEIHAAFRGIASVQTIKGIAKASSFMEIDDDKIKTLRGSNLANVTYDFEAKNSSDELLLSGKSSPAGKKKTKKAVPLTIGSFEIGIQIVHEGVGNWSLNIREIKVTTGIEHNRVIKEEYPRNGSESLNMTYKTNVIY